MPEPQPPPEPRWRIEELLRPDAFAHPAEPLSLLETHLSWVVLAGEFAYKIKKALAVDFVDASTLGKRARLCAEELRLNRRLAPELYVSVVDIRRGSGGVHIGGDGELLDHAQ